MNLSPSEIRDRAEQARGLLSQCTLCAHRCGVERAAGALGKCRAGVALKVATALLHTGEEPCLGPHAGTVFFSHCNLGCVYCQNWQISREGQGNDTDADGLASMMLRLQDDGAANIDLVSPTHYVPQIIEALAIAADRGLTLPVVYNTGGYDTLETLRLLDGIVDVYLPDMRYSWNPAAERYSGAAGYVETNRSAVAEMYRQVGELAFNSRGQATRGLLIRLLILPNSLAGVHDTLRWIAANLSTDTWFSLMAQYSPLHRAADFPELSRPINDREYHDLLDLTERLGLINFYAQSPGSQDSLRPDFDDEQPFEK